MTRIIGGNFRGRNLKVPDSVTRPTSSRVREAVFSSVEHAVSGLSDLRVLDLFAGSGALGIEAISRGAAEVVLIEKDLRAVDVLHTNIAELKVENARVVIADVLQEVKQNSTRGKFDVVFVDAPYATADDEITEVILGLAANNWLAEYAVLVVERGSKSVVTWPKSYEELRKKVYGDTAIWYGQYIGIDEKD
ncbi:MAG: 16S rRNA (guanine(966)-N(2))-methyltransferase RsmD [Actinomycetes bacterium]